MNKHLARALLGVIVLVAIAALVFSRQNTATNDTNTPNYRVESRPMEVKEATMPGTAKEEDNAAEQNSEVQEANDIELELKALEDEVLNLEDL